MYLKDGEVQHPAGVTPQPWFDRNPLALAKQWKSAGAEQIYIQDLNISTKGKNPNAGILRSIQKETGLSIFVTGDFRSVDVVAQYLQEGLAEAVVMGASAYQTQNLFKETCQRFPGKVAVMIEVKNGRVAIPGWVTPSHKTAFDYVERFQEEGAAAIVYSDFATIADFCSKISLPVWANTEPQNLKEIETVAILIKNRPQKIVLGRVLYEGKLDLHATTVYLNDLDVGFSQEETIQPEE